MSKKITIDYFAQLRDEAGCSSEVFQSSANDLAALYKELVDKHGFSLKKEKLRVALNDEFCEWDKSFSEGDKAVFIPPVAGG